MSSIAPNPDRHAQARLKRVVRRIYDIPSFPEVILRLAEVADDPDSSSADLAAVMEKDQALAAKILRLVNSAFYSLSRPVASLHHAISLIGFNSVRALAISVSVRSSFPTDGDPVGRMAFWEHSLFVACATRTLGSRLRLPGGDDLFTAGLMHDLGVLVARQHLPEEMQEADRLVRECGAGAIQAERQVVGVEHPLLGAWLAEHWRLPPIIHAAIRDHHDALSPDWSERCALDEESRRAVELVALGDRLAQAAGRPRIPDAPPVLERIPEHLIRLLDGADPDRLAAEILRQAEGAREFITS
ncbi:MAG: HDOD domain-containing protein [Planctomycetota bacterium]|jgi:HD-like signal output (HDOD) protein